MKIALTGALLASALMMLPLQFNNRVALRSCNQLL